MPHRRIADLTAAGTGRDRSLQQYKFPKLQTGITMFPNPRQGFTAKTKTYNAGKAVTPTGAKRNAGVS